MNEIPVIRKAKFPRAFKNGFRGAYDHLGYVVFATLAAFISTTLFFSLAFLLGATHFGIAGFLLFIPSAFIAFLWAVGVFYYAHKSVFREHPSPIDTWNGIKILFAPAIRLFIVDLLITVLLIADVVFFAGMAKNGFVFMILSIVFAYLAIAWLITVMYHLPILIAQLNMESGTGVLVVLRKSLLLTVDNLGFTLGFFVVIIAFAALCILPGAIGMALLFLGSVAFILNHALRELFIKYEIVEDEPEDVVEEKWKLPESWRKRDKQAD